jgi:hypothetical protein
VKRPRTILWLTLLLALLALALSLVQSHCPTQGLGFLPSQRAEARLKNRTALPRETDFDSRVTLIALLQAGDDRARWSPARAARVEGYVVAVSEGGIEAANCFALVNRDTHIDLALRADAPPRERVILEVTPRLREWARQQGRDWSTPALQRDLVGHWCRFEGWLFFDDGHATESDNIAPGGKHNWRATSWEIHPVTYIEAVK